MCGRFALTLPKTAAAKHFQASLWPEPRDASTILSSLDHIDRPRYNVKPTETILTVALDDAGARMLRPMRWGFLPHWTKTLSEGPLLINARSETIADKLAFRASVRKRRCLVPADGFYEWRVAETGRKTKRGRPIVEKTPYWIHPATAPEEGPAMAFAGVWRAWEDPDGQTIASVAIVTCAANETMAALHERLPIAIAPERYGLWLGEEGHGAAVLMGPPAEDFYAFHPVSPAINAGGAAALDGPELQAPAEIGGEDAADDESEAEPRLL